jgi:hypothetical protein
MSCDVTMVVVVHLEDLVLCKDVKQHKCPCQSEFVVAYLGMNFVLKITNDNKC